MRAFFIMYNQIKKKMKHYTIQKQIAQLTERSTLEVGNCEWWYRELWDVPNKDQEASASAPIYGGGGLVTGIALVSVATFAAFKTVLHSIRRKLMVYFRIKLRDKMIKFSIRYTFYDTRLGATDSYGSVHGWHKKINPLDSKLPLTVTNQDTFQPKPRSGVGVQQRKVYVVKHGEQYIILPKNKQVKKVWTRRNNKT